MTEEVGEYDGTWKDSILSQLQRNQKRFHFLVRLIETQQKLQKERNEYKDKWNDLTIMNRMENDVIDNGRKRTNTVGGFGRSSMGDAAAKKREAIFERRYKEAEKKVLDLEEKYHKIMDSQLKLYQKQDELNQSEKNALNEAKEAASKVSELEAVLLAHKEEIEELQAKIEELESLIGLRDMQCNHLQTELNAVNLQFVTVSGENDILRRENEEHIVTILKLKEELATMHNQTIIDAQKAREEKVRQELADATKDMPDVSKSVRTSKSFKSYIPSKAVHTIADAHPGGGRVVSFDIGGSKFASGGVDHSVKLWSPAGHLIETLTGHTGTITSIDFSTSTNFLLSSSNDKSVNIWDLETKRSKFSLTSHTDKVYTARFLSGTKLVSASQDRSIVLWSAVRGASERTFLQNSTCFDIVPLDGTRFISSHYDKHLREWDTRQKGSKPAREYKTSHNQVISHIVPSPDRRYLLTCSKDSTLEYVDLFTLQTECIFSSDSMTIGHHACRPSFSSNGYNFAVGGTSGEVHIWDVNSKSILKTLSRSCHDAPVACVDWKGSQVISTGLDGKVIIWEDDE